MSRAAAGPLQQVAEADELSFDLIRFLDEIDDTIAPAEGQQIIAIMDNLSTHKSNDVQDWLKGHSRWRFVFTPNHASWLNQIEIVFSIMCRRLLKHGHFDSPDDLAKQMLAYIEAHNETARPFNWDLHRQGPHSMSKRNCGTDH